jgi:hypothetical protein
MVDFPVPAMPLSQNIDLLSLLFAHVLISSSSLLRVFGKHRALCSSVWES